MVVELSEVSEWGQLVLGLLELNRVKVNATLLTILDSLAQHPHITLIADLTVMLKMVHQIYKHIRSFPCLTETNLRPPIIHPHRHPFTLPLPQLKFECYQGRFGQVILGRIKSRQWHKVLILFILVLLLLLNRPELLELHPSFSHLLTPTIDSLSVLGSVLILLNGIDQLLAGVF